MTVGKTWTGVVVASRPHGVSIALDGVDGDAAVLDLRAGGAVAAQAAALVGRAVSFQVDLSERTSSLLAPQYCLRSAYGLRPAP